MLINTLVVITIVVLWVSAQLTARDSRGRVETRGRFLDSSAAIAFVAAVTFGVLWYAWAAWNPIPVVHDEMAYVLQSEILARGHWALPSPPMPMFWQQPHVLTDPSLTSKYFPGHSLAMMPGALLGWPAMMPLLLNAASAALLFVLARRIASAGVAFLAWVIWLISPMMLYFGASYFSEVTTTVCWLGGWYALLRWRDGRSPRWLLLVAVLTGWDALTRPLTGVAYAIPIAFVVLRDVWRLRLWKDLAAAFAAGAVVMAILPVWSISTTGHWTLTPLTLYTRQYMPYDVPGFGLITTPAQHVLTPELVQLNNTYSSVHVDHFAHTLPATLLDRWLHLTVSTYGSTSGVLMIFGIIGLLCWRKETGFAIATSAVLILIYLSFATPARWTLYYFETTPVFAVVTASGMAWCASLVGRPRGVKLSSRYRWDSGLWNRSLVLTSACVAITGVISLQLIRGQHVSDRTELTRFGRLLATIRDPRAVVFVRHSPLHSPHVTYVRNVANPDEAHLWVVYDRGERENAEFLRHAAGRTPYLFDEVRKRLYVY